MPDFCRKRNISILYYAKAMIWYSDQGLKICLKYVKMGDVCVEWTCSAWRIISIMKRGIFSGKGNV